ncbi:MAG: efflux RND transporter periplasmic adaptor subunit [Paludibacter sp.]|nr:efflux RND transporter periplasmic adaptor subunit [Paludibacter sp.]
MKRFNPKTIYPLLILMLSIGLLNSCKKSEEEKKDVPTAKVQKGTFYLDLYEEGEIEAINSTNITAPSISWRFGNLKITQMVKDGEEVKKGDTLIVFDQSDVKKGVIEAESRLQMSYAELEKLQAQQQSDLDGLQSDYEITRLSQEISKIRFESAGYEAEIKKKEIKLNLEKANIALARSKEQIENKIKIQKEEIKQKNLSIQQDVDRLKEANETIKKMFLISPTSGIAIINSNWSTGNKFQIGDQCWAGFPLILLPDLTALRANVKINEVDISKIIKGLKVEIKPDAFSDSLFSGEVTSVANLAVDKDNKSKIKVFPVEIKINEINEKLLPGLNVSCRIILGRIENAIFVPLEAVQSEGSTFFVYKKTAGGFEKTVVETSDSNSDFIVITKGLTENDKVALANPFVKDEKVKPNETKSESQNETTSEDNQL